MSARSSCAVGQRVLDLELEAGPGARLRDERRENSVGPRRANRLLLLRLGAIDRQRDARPVSDERAIDVPCVLPRLARRTLARKRIARVHRVVAHVHVEGVAPAGRCRASCALRCADRRCRCPTHRRSARGLPESACRAGSRAAGESVDANVGVVADELLQHLRELFGIVRQRGKLFCGQLFGERAEQLRVFVGRQHFDLFREAGNLQHDVAAGLRAGAHTKVFHVERCEPRRFDARRVIARRQRVEQRLAAFVRRRVARRRRPAT